MLLLSMIPVIVVVAAAAAAAAAAVNANGVFVGEQGNAA